MFIYTSSLFPEEKAPPSEQWWQNFVETASVTKYIGASRSPDLSSHLLPRCCRCVAGKKRASDPLNVAQAKTFPAMLVVGKSSAPALLRLNPIPRPKDECGAFPEAQTAVHLASPSSADSSCETSCCFRHFIFGDKSMTSADLLTVKTT